MNITEWYRKIRKYIGPVELVLICGLIAGGVYNLDRRAEKQRQQIILQELKALTIENDKFQQEQEQLLRELENPIQTLDSTYLPFVVDSLCLYTDASRKQGFFTLTKYAPSLDKFRFNGNEYYMWIEMNRYFPEGQLVKVTKVAENDDLFQFYFTIDSNEKTLDDMLGKLDSTLRTMQDIQPNAQSR